MPNQQLAASALPGAVSLASICQNPVWSKRRGWPANACITLWSSVSQSYNTILPALPQKMRRLLSTWSQKEMTR